MTCGELDILLCDYLDGTLSAGEAARVESHLSSCASCAELARDARLAMSFMERASEMEPPPQLMTRILHETASGKHGRLGSSRGIRSWFEKSLAFVLQPRLVMGMALTIFSFSMMARCPGIATRQLRPGDMDPKKIWAVLDDRAHRGWERSVKFYENIKVVYEIQSRLRDWTDQQDEEDRNAAAKRPVEERRVPAQSGK
jgi:Predicted transmembrane transcriptional regulator (anti-sigma factor)